MRQHIFAVPPCAGQGADPRTATGRPIRWGVVATGQIARKVTADLALLEDSVLQAVSSRREPNAAAFAAEFGFVTSYHDDDGGAGYQRLVQDPAVDVVYVATPHTQHREVAAAALSAGKHVLCEKPFTVNAAEAEELVDLARANGVFLMEAVWTRFLPSVNRAWDIIASGEIGDVEWVQADLGFAAPYDAGSRLWDPAAGGGALLDLAVYPLTWALGSLGQPEEVMATGTLHDDGVDIRNALTLRYANGGFAQLVTSIASVCPSTATLTGSAGWIKASASLCNPLELTIQGAGGEVRTETFEQFGGNWIYQLREVARCVQEGLLESPTMPLVDTVSTMRLLDDVRAQLGLAYASDSQR